MKLIRRKSLATDLSLYLILTITIIFIVITVLYFRLTRKEVVNSNLRDSMSLMKNASQNMNFGLLSSANDLNRNCWILNKNLQNKEFIDSIIVHNIDANDLIEGSSIAFEPSNNGGELKMIYGLRVDNIIVLKEIDTSKYNYEKMDWYSIPKEEKRALWSTPYFDEGAGDKLMTTYSIPLMDSKGNLIAIYTLDLSLIKFSEYIKSILPFEDSNFLIINKDGEHRYYDEPILSSFFESENSTISKIISNMISGVAGYEKFKFDDTVYYGLYEPFQDREWAICCIVKEDVLLNDLKSLYNSIFFIFVVGILLLYIFTYLGIKHKLRHLKDFANSATIIAEGNFDVSIPKIKENNEMRQLREAFCFMQESLKKYMANLKENTIKNERIKSELNIAHNIQMGMLPKKFPPFPDKKEIDIYGSLIPAKEVGGDLYDFNLVGNKLFFQIGDVSGKGIPASLFMAMTQSLFRVLANGEITPQELMCKLNNSTCQQNDYDMFITMFIGVLDIKTGVLEYCNAGHNPPLIMKSNGEASYLKPLTNIPLGLIPTYNYQEELIKLDSGTKIICYTDGVVESENINRDLFSSALLKDLVIQHSNESSERIVEIIVEKVKEHSKGVMQSDDFTIMSIEYKK